MKINYIINRIVFNLKTHGIKKTVSQILMTVFKRNKINLDELIKDTPKSLDEIFLKFGTDKGSLDGKKSYYHYYRFKDNKYRNYFDWVKRENLKNFKYKLGLNSTPIYENIFRNVRNDKLKILELGVANGHSIASWHHYFKNSIIYGVDMKDESKFFYKSKRVKYFQMNIFDKKKVKTFINNHGPFDFIIDDSVNTKQAMIININNFFPCLKKGGVFFLEDVGFFKLNSNAFKDIENFNKKNGYEYFIDNRDMHEILTDLIEGKYIPDSFFNVNEINYLKNNVHKIEVPNYDHPHAGMILLFKK